MVELSPLHHIGDHERRVHIVKQYLECQGIVDMLETGFSKPSNINDVIPVYNEAQNIGATLDSLSQTIVASGHSATIIVVNNNSTDDTTRVVREHQALPTPILILQNPIKGIAPTRKLGMDQVVLSLISNRMNIQPSYIFMADGDTIYPVDWLKSVYTQFTQTNSDVVTGVYEYPDWVDQHIFESTKKDHFFRNFSLLSLLLMENGLSILPSIGSNTGIEAVSYATVGGINPALVKASDHDLGQKVQQRGGVVSSHDAIVQTSPRRALVSMLEGVDFATTNMHWRNIRCSDKEMLTMVINCTSEGGWEDQKRLREGYLVLGRVVLPIIQGKISHLKLKEFLGSRHRFIMQLEDLLKQVTQGCDVDVQVGAARRFAFDNSNLLLRSCESTPEFDELVSRKASGVGVH